jgi:hypothetical protein
MNCMVGSQCRSPVGESRGKRSRPHGPSRGSLRVHGLRETKDFWGREGSRAKLWDYCPDAGTEIIRRKKLPVLLCRVFPG